MTLDISEKFLKEVLLKVEFHCVPKLLGESGDPSDFESVILSEFPKFSSHDGEFAEGDLYNELVINEQHSNKFWVYEKEDIKKIQLKNSSLTLSYNGEYFKSSNCLIEDSKLIINALKNISVEKTTSIKLRYINEITPKDKIENGDEWINPTLHNFNFQPENSKLIRSLNRAEYKINDFDLIFQYGQFNLNYPSTVIKNDFILDYNCFTNNLENINNVKDKVIEMNKIIGIFYNNSIGKILK